MSSSLHLYHHIALDPQSLDAITDQIIERLNATLPQANATAIATAVKSALDGNFQTLAQELRQMSASVSQQITTEVTRISADVQRLQNGVDNVRSDISALADRLQPGEPVSQEVINQLRAAVDSLGAVTDDHAAAVTALNDLANPAPPTP